MILPTAPQMRSDVLRSLGILLNSTGPFDPALGRVSDVTSFAVLAVGISPIVSTTVGTAGLCLTGVAPWAEYLAIWPVWLVGDAMGVLFVAPVLLTSFAGR